MLYNRNMAKEEAKIVEELGLPIMRRKKKEIIRQLMHTKAGIICTESIVKSQIL